MRRSDTSVFRTHPVCGSLLACVTGLGLVIALLLLVFAAVSEPLHHWLHPDSDEPDHHCAVELFAAGDVWVADVQAAAVLPDFWCLGTLAWFVIELESTFIHLPPARGPPLSARFVNCTPA